MWSSSFWPEPGTCTTHGAKTCIVSSGYLYKFTLDFSTIGPSQHATGIFIDDIRFWQPICDTCYKDSMCQEPTPCCLDGVCVECPVCGP